jgi:cell division protein FtsL
MNMNIQRSHILGFIGLVGFAFALYWAKAEAQSAREQVVSLQNEVDKQRRDVRTLEAEVAWLQRPDRIEATARTKMGLVPSKAEQTASLDDLDEFAPMPAAPEPKAEVTGQQVREPSQ